MSEISINTVENIDEVEQIILLTTLQNYIDIIGLPYIFWIFTKTISPKFHPPLLLTPLPPFITLARVGVVNQTVLVLF